jgi:crotonobetainyl-CoA:carnitine CoA-transferase CaiB-like acyl-CoA transferase
MTDGPLKGIRVLDFGHTVMGPCCGMILADLGAEVLKIEPAPGGDPTRRLKGFGTGYFGFFNRNKHSLAVDLKTPEGNELIRKLVAEVDVVIENFGPGTMERLSIGYEMLSAINPRLVFASLKGFFDGPYGSRLALDEIVQMMSGLAYMTGPKGMPLRAGSSVIDIVGGMFAVIGIQAALRQRDMTGRGQLVGSSLYESAVFLMGQHLCYADQIDEPVPPMPNRVSAWAVYDIFPLQDEERLFVGITSDAHWQRFTAEAGLSALAADPELQTNNQRITARPKLMAELRTFFASLQLPQAIALCERSRIPFAEVRRPEQLFDDPHLAATEGLMTVALPDGTNVRLPALPIAMEGVTKTASNPPPAGDRTWKVLTELGLSAEEISGLIEKKVVLAMQGTEPAFEQ